MDRLTMRKRDLYNWTGQENSCHTVNLLLSPNFSLMISLFGSCVGIFHFDMNWNPSIDDGDAKKAINNNVEINFMFVTHPPRLSAMSLTSKRWLFVDV